MKKLSPIFVLLALVIFLFSCEKDIQQKKCYQVKYISDYCTEQNSVRVKFSMPNTDATPVKNSAGETVEYQAAVLNVPASYRIQGKIFYIKYHYNSNDLSEVKSCPTGADAIKILTADGVSDDDCNVN